MTKVSNKKDSVQSYREENKKQLFNKEFEEMFEELKKEDNNKPNEKILPVILKRNVIDIKGNEIELSSERERFLVHENKLKEFEDKVKNLKIEKRPIFTVVNKIGFADEFKLEDLEMMKIERPKGRSTRN